MRVDPAPTPVSLQTRAPDNRDRLKEASAQVLGKVFYGTLLKTMRQSVLKGPYGHGGRGEEVFTARLDGLLAERMGEAASNGKENFLFEWLSRQRPVFDAPGSMDPGRKGSAP